MRSKVRKSVFLFFPVFVLLAGAPFVFSGNFSTYAQNQISGYVFGQNRRPVADVHVELANDYYQTIGRTRTNGSGYYSFSNVNSGAFVIKVLTGGTEYEEQESRVEIQNFTVGTRTVGASNEQRDFYLRLRKGAVPENVVVFAQDIPPEAKKLYEKAVSDLDNKRNSEGLGELRSAIVIFPKYYAALERLGTEYIKLDKPEAYQAAEILLMNAVEVNARGFKSWYGLAYARYSQDKFAEALVAVEKAVELNAYSSEAAFLAGILMKKAKKYPEAEKNLLKAKDLSKDSIPQVHWELALLYGNDLKRYSDAAKELRAFLKAQPNAKDSDNIKKLIAEFEAKAQKT